MAKWTVSKNREGIRKLSYTNLVSGETSECGDLFHNVTNDLVVDWIVKAGDPNPGDIVVFDDGLVLQIMGTVSSMRTFAS